MPKDPSQLFINTTADPGLVVASTPGIDNAVHYPTDAVPVSNTIINVIQYNLNTVGANNEVLINSGNIATGDPELTYDANTNILTAETLHLGNLNVSFRANLGNASNIKITGGSDGYVLKTDGTGNLSWTSQEVASVTWTSLTGKPSLATVATSGDYNDLANKPSGGASTTYVDNKIANVTYANISGTPTLATVATSGRYNDLTNLPNLSGVALSGNYNDLANKPNIPSIAGLASMTYVDNKFANVTYANLPDKPTIPTHTGNLINNSGYITSSALSGYALTSSLPTDIANLTDTTHLLGQIDTGNITFNGDEIASTNDIVNILGNNYAQLQSNSTYIWVEDGNANIQVNENTWGFDSTGNITLPSNDAQINYANGQSILDGLGAGGGSSYDQDLNKTDNVEFAGLTMTGKVIAKQDSGTDGGYTFGGDEGGGDTGMFSAADGVLDFYSNDEKIVRITTDSVEFSRNITSNGLEIYTNEGSEADIDLYTDWDSGNGVEVWLQHNDRVSITTENGTYSWDFDKTGNLTLPAGGDILDSTGTSVLGGTDLTGYATETYVGTAISNLVNSSPAALNTLSELANALGNDASYSTTISTALGNRLRVDTNSQGLNGTQQANARTNLGLATVASSGSYNDLTNKPTLGNISSINTDGNASNILYGNGVFSAAPVIPSITLDNASAGDMDVMIYDGNIKYTSNVTIDASTGTLKANLFSGNSIQVGGSLGYSDSANLISVEDKDGFGQVLFQNKNSGANASMNIVLVNDSPGTDYMAIGINSSTFSPLYNTIFELPNAGYISHTTDTIIGPQSDHSASSSVYLTYNSGANALQINGKGAIGWGASYDGTLVEGDFGTNGQVLTSSGPSSAPTWTTISGGGTSYDQDLNKTDNVTFNTVNTQVVYAPVGAALELYSGDGTPIPKSIVLNGTSGYMTIPSSPDWIMGKTWTFEFRIKMNATSVGTGVPWRLINQEQDNAVECYMGITISGGELSILCTQSNALYFTEPTPGQWVHVAVVNNNVGPVVYYNGVAQTYTQGYGGPANYTSSNAITIGRFPNNNYQYFPGEITGIRISDVVRYTQNFTPTTETFDIDSNLLLLMNVLDGQEYTDSSSYNRTISNYNTTLGTVPGIGLDPGNVVVTANSQSWTFGTDGTTIFPTLTIPRGDSVSSTITGQTLMFGDNSQEAIISTPNGSGSYADSQRLVINPGKGYEGGEGGDIYLWAGRGGNASGTGGDIKIRGGQGGANTLGGSGGDGGYIRIEAGDGANQGNPGYIEMTAGEGGIGKSGGYANITGGIGHTTGGDVQITGGRGRSSVGGNVNIWGGSSDQGPSSEGHVNIETGGNTWAFDAISNLTIPGGGVINNDGDTNVVNIVGSNYAQLQSNENYIWVEENDAAVLVNGYQWTFHDNAVLELANGANISQTTDEGGHKTFNITPQEVSDFEVITIDGNIRLQTANSDGGITTSIWTFDKDGNLTLPGGGVLGDAFNDGGLTLKSPAFQYVELGSYDGNVYAWVADKGYYAGEESSFIIGTDYTGDDNRWKFSATGSVSFPSGAGFSKGESGQLKVNDSTTTSLDLRDSGGRGFYTNNDGVTLRSNGSQNWYFGYDGITTLPGAIHQNYTTTKGRNYSGISSGTTSDIWVAEDLHMTSVKLTVQIESRTGSPYYDNFDTMTCEIVMAKKKVSGEYTAAPITVYGIVHTSADPLATFSSYIVTTPGPDLGKAVLTCTPDASITDTCFVRVHSVEMFSSSVQDDF
jgi:hypothetical protein